MPGKVETGGGNYEQGLTRMQKVNEMVVVFFMYQLFTNFNDAFVFICSRNCRQKVLSYHL
jgi:hypothetical protein